MKVYVVMINESRRHSDEEYVHDMFKHREDAEESASAINNDRSIDTRVLAREASVEEWEVSE